MGGIAGAALGAIGSAFGGNTSSGSSSESSQSSSTTRPVLYVPTAAGYQAQANALNSTLGNTQTTVQNLNQSNQTMSMPYMQSSYSALDTLLDSMGIARPEEGSYQAAVDQGNYQDQLNAYNAYQTAQQAYVKQGNQVRSDLENALNSDYYPFAKGGSVLSSEFGPGKPVAENTQAFLGGDMTNNPQNYTLAQMANDDDLNYKQAQYDGTSNSTGAQADLAAYQEYQNYVNNAPTAVADPTAPATPQMTDPTQASQTIMNLITNNPNYQFQLQQGNQAVNAKAAALGYNSTPQVLQQLQTFGQGLASSSLQSYQQQLMGIVNSGLTASQTASNSNTAAASNISNLQQNLGAQVANANLNATNNFVTGPWSTQSSSSSSGSSSSKSGPQVLGEVANAGGSFLSALGGL